MNLTKKLFEENFPEDSILVEDEYCWLIGQLDSSDLPEKLANFVREVYKIKKDETERLKNIETM